jgi:hypothetical protein
MISKGIKQTATVLGGFLAFVVVVWLAGCRGETPSAVDQEQRRQAAIRELEYVLAGATIADPRKKAEHMWAVAAKREHQKSEVFQYSPVVKLGRSVEFGRTAHDWSVIKCWPVSGDPMQPELMVAVCGRELFGLNWFPAKELPGLSTLGPFGSDLLEGEAVMAREGGGVEVRFRLRR